MVYGKLHGSFKLQVHDDKETSEKQFYFMKGLLSGKWHGPFTRSYV